MQGAESPDGGHEDEWFTYRMDPDERPTEAVVIAVSAVRNRPVTELEPLTEVVDPDALDSFCSGRTESDSKPRLRFTYSDCVVEVTNPLVRVRALD